MYSHYILACLRYVKRNQHLYSLRADIHGYNTRRRGLLDVPRVRLSRTQKGLSTAAIKFFNRLPASVKTMEERPFVKKLSSFFKLRAYSVGEFLEDDLGTLA